MVVEMVVVAAMEVVALMVGVVAMSCSTAAAVWDSKCLSAPWLLPACFKHAYVGRTKDTPFSKDVASAQQGMRAEECNIRIMFPCVAEHTCMVHDDTCMVRDFGQC